MTSSPLAISSSVSANTQAILLLTAPLIAGQNEISQDLLTQREYGRLLRFLDETERQPADLLTSDPEPLFVELAREVNIDRLRRLTSRSFLLSQAIERWKARAIWVVSRQDEEYPIRLRERLNDMAPPVLYGCGDANLLNIGGLAVVGSRNADNSILEYTMRVGRLAAEARRTLVSGGARGIDQAAMRGAMIAGGNAVGVLSDGLERTSLNHENRKVLMDGNLVLISPYDPSASFNVGHAMQRNKLVYALADAALVINSDYGKGGTWAGAVEQLKKLKLVPVYVRNNGNIGAGLEALSGMGALPWPEPDTSEALGEVLSAAINRADKIPDTEQLAFSTSYDDKHDIRKHKSQGEIEAPVPADTSTGLSADEHFAKVKRTLEQMDRAKTEKEIANELKVSRIQARAWLQRLVNEGVLEKRSRPTRYQSTNSSDRLF